MIRPNLCDQRYGRIPTVTSPTRRAMSGHGGEGDCRLVATRASPPDPGGKEEKIKDLTFWPTESRLCCTGSRASSPGGTRSAGTWDCRSRSPRAGHGICTRRLSKPSRQWAHLGNSRASSPRPSPTRCRAHCKDPKDLPRNYVPAPFFDDAPFLGCRRSSLDWSRSMIPTRRAWWCRHAPAFQCSKLTLALEAKSSGRYQSITMRPHDLCQLLSPPPPSPYVPQRRYH